MYFLMYLTNNNLKFISKFFVFFSVEIFFVLGFFLYAED